MTRSEQPPTTMEALLYKDGALHHVTDHPVPQPAFGESLVRITRAAICNTDREVLKGYRPNFVGILGHEFVGVVIASEEPSLIGRHVVGELNAACGECLYCRTGRPTHCEHRRVLGMENKDGCFAEYMTIATELLHVVPEGLSDDEAVFTEPLAAALEIPEQSYLPPSYDAAVVGDGRLAFMIAQVLALEGRHVTVFGHHEEKLERFRPFADVSLSPQGSFEIVVEASGHPSGLKDAVALCRSRGLLILKSTYAGDITIDMSELVVREITLRGSRCGPFPPAIQLLHQKRIILPPIELHALEAYDEAFRSKAFKVGFKISD